MKPGATIPIRDALPPWPRYESEEIEAVSAVLRSGQGNYTYGAVGREFERKFADWCGARFGLAVANGTVGLELALRGVEITQGDDVVVTARSFVASASAALLCGATPVFADVGRDSQNLTPATIEAVLSDKTRAIIVVHLAGWPCEMDAILGLAKKRGIAVIEDCAQAHGATWRNRRVGSFGDAAVFSFCHDKIMSTGGEGGMVLAGREDVRDRMDAWRRHGRREQPDDHSDPPYLYRFVHEGLGSNYRLTEMQSAIGRCQLAKVDGWLMQRRENASRYTDGFSGIPGLRCPMPPADAAHAWYKYYVFVRPETLRQGWDRDRILKEAWERGLPCWQGSCGELYKETVFADTGSVPPAPLPVAHELAETAMMFPVHPGISRAQIDAICSGMRSVMSAAVN